MKVLKSYDVDFIFNAAYRRGQTASIQASVSQLDQDAEGFMVCLGDMPLLAPSDYNSLIQFFYLTRKEVQRPIVRPVFKDSVGHPVIFDAFYKDAILKHEEPEGCRTLIQENRQNFRAMEVSTLQYFFDIDNPDDYRRLIISSDNR